MMRCLAGLGSVFKSLVELIWRLVREGAALLIGFSFFVATGYLLTLIELPSYEMASVWMKLSLPFLMLLIPLHQAMSIIVWVLSRLVFKLEEA